MDIRNWLQKDPCLYILRFAAKLEFGAKTQQVANTALRLVQRMKRDSIHSGRRPSGLCGAALLMASRLHEFSRSASDIVKIVKVHESTLRKRLIEFGDTPSSALTLEEFMTVDLEEEQDPPSFKAARKKDKERLQKLMEEEADSITDLQKQIEHQLDKDGTKKRMPLGTGTPGGSYVENEETSRFINESTLGTIEKIMSEENVDDPDGEPVKELGPDIASMGLANSLEDTSNALQTEPNLDVDFTFDDIDDAELDMYIMSEHEFKCKEGLWQQRNAAYLEEQKNKAEKLQKEREEGKPEKKKKRTVRKKIIGPANSAGEAIEKILQEKKISAKINYDVLKSLNAAPVQNEPAVEDDAAPTTSDSIKRRRQSSVSSLVEQTPSKRGRPSNKKEKQMGLPFVENAGKEVKEDFKVEKKEELLATVSEEEIEDEEDDYVHEEPAKEMGVLEMLRKHREDDEGEYYDYDYDEY